MTTSPKNPFDVQLDAEEQEILREVEAGEWQEISNVEEEKQRIQTLVRQASAKTKRVTFRLTAGDLHALQMKAREEGIPYQTLISSILTGRLVAR